MTARSVRSAATAVGLLAAAVSVSLLAPGQRALDVGGLALLLALSVPSAFRQRVPVATLVLTAVAAAPFHALRYSDEATLPALLLALYTVAATGDRRRSYLAGSMAALVVVVVAVATRDASMLDTAGWFVAALGAGAAVNQGRTRAVEAELRAASTERAREAETARRVAEERLRLARDLHDVLAHGITTISVQASVAEHLLRQRDRPDDERLARALDAVAATSRRTTADVRSLLAVLRDADDPAGIAPSPTLADVPHLVRDAAAETVSTHLDIAGTPRALPPAVEITAYRVIQEALTNVLKHASASRVDVELDYTGEGLCIRVVDDGCGAADPGTVSGHGLNGMHERVRLVGGRLDARARSTAAGFAVTAWLPTLRGA